MKPKLSEVFVPGGLPELTYNPRSEKHLESNLQKATLNLSKLVIVTGHTKTGKTVLVLRTLPRTRAIWVDGGAVGNDLAIMWDEINSQLDVATSTAIRTSQENATSGKASLKGSFLPALFTRIEGKASTEISRVAGVSHERTRDSSPRAAALRALRCSKLPLIIDDFHFLDRDAQREVIRALKGPIFDGLPVIVIAIPHKQYDAVRVEREMAGRIHAIHVPEWTVEELEFIAYRGFAILERSIDPIWVRHIAENSIGSPHLMQDVLSTLCSRYVTAEGELAPSLLIDENILATAYSTVAASIGRPIFEKLAEGPTSRTDRIVRKLKNGQEVDIYGLVLRAIAELKPELETLSYDDIRSAIRDVSGDDDLPAKHEVTRVLKKMSSIAATEQSSSRVIEFDDDDKLHIVDPFFAFFLRHGDTTL
jgi:hypothetical protein